jgi:FtsP/CotA-like multicopper oxidase with cupredoxin domain
MLINGKGNVNCPGVPFLMNLVPPPVLPLLLGMNLSDKGCLPLMNPIVQTSYPHNFGAVPFGMFEGCNATDPNPYVFNVDANGGWVSLNMISTASIQEMIVSIDEHPMWIYEVDGTFIEPQLVDVRFLSSILLATNDVQAMTLQHGSRHSVMVQLDKPAKDYTIRVAGSGLNQKIFVSGILSYRNGNHENTPKPYIDYAGVNTTADVTFLNDATVVPFPPVHPAQIADQTYKLVLNRTGAAWQWNLNDDMPFNESLEEINPLLFDPKGLAGTNLAITTKNGTWVDLVYISTNTGGAQ